LKKIEINKQLRRRSMISKGRGGGTNRKSKNVGEKTCDDLPESREVGSD